MKLNGNVISRTNRKYHSINLLNFQFLAWFAFAFVHSTHFTHSEESSTSARFLRRSLIHSLKLPASLTRSLFPAHSHYDRHMPRLWVFSVLVIITSTVEEEEFVLSPHRPHPPPISNPPKCTERVQDMLPQNVISCHTEYFQLKESEKWQVQERLPDLRPGAGHKTVVGQVPALYQEEGSTFTSKDEGTQTSERTDLTEFPSVYPFSHHIFPQLSTLHQT